MPEAARPALSPSRTFAILWMVAILLEYTERWDHPVYVAGYVAIVTAIVFAGVTRARFLAVLVLTTAQLLLMHFPDVANHVNLILLTNLLLITALAHSLVRSPGAEGEESWFGGVRPVLQLTLVLVYFLAGFHKLNTDFINPDVSCVQRTISQLREMFRSNVYGVPAVPLLAVGAVGVAGWLISGPAWRRYAGRIAAAGVVVALGAGAFALLPANLLPTEAKAALALPLIAVVLCWEIIGGLLLTVPRAQLAVVAFSWSMHATLALVTFVDFGSLALALLFCFVPESYQRVIGGHLRLPSGGPTLTRPQAYLLLAIVVGFLNLSSILAGGMVFNAAALVLLWPLLAALAGRAERLPWPGVPISLRATPVVLLVFPFMLLLHGITGYVGLRTAGNFSMFSNLRTEGARSNHLVLGSNPFKVFDYQEDVVRVLALDDATARIGYQYQPLRGSAIPVVEFRKIVDRWTDAGWTVPITLEYRGETQVIADIVNHPEWRSRGWDWEMRTMDFRVIQADSPNRCRW